MLAFPISNGMSNTALLNLWATVLASIHSMGVTTFAVAIIITIVLYRIHPIIGILGVLILFGFLAGLIH